MRRQWQEHRRKTLSFPWGWAEAVSGHVVKEGFQEEKLL